MKPISVHQISEVTFLWLRRLRWVAAAGQLLAVALVYALGLEVSSGLLLLVAALTALSNQLLGLWSASKRVVSGVLALDIFLLTLLLVGSGGASSPFSLLYLIHITLAAVTLDPRWTGLLSGLAILCYGSLFLLPNQHSAHQHDFSLHLYGMWFAFALTASALAYFVARVSDAHAQAERALVSAREATTRAERLAALSTLAAGAAHELGTPLATIAVSAKELERSAKNSGNEQLREEASLIRAEVERCRLILTRMRAQAGESVGEAPSLLTPDELAAQLIDALGAKLSSRVTLSLSSSIRAPRLALVQSLVSLVRNGLDASPEKVHVNLRAEGESVLFEIKDQGAPIAPEVLARIGEPFFTTKPPGLGMGLGFFLCCNFASMLGGRCWLSSSLDGTTATLQLPRG